MTTIKDSLSREINRWYAGDDTCLVLVLRKDKEGYFFASSELPTQLFIDGQSEVVGTQIINDLRREYARGLESLEP